MKIAVLDRATVGFDLDFTVLDRLGEVTVYDYTERNELLERIKPYDVIIINKIKVTEEIIKVSPNLKLVCVFATGFDNVDISAAKQYGVGVANVPAYSTDSVALFTIATVLSLTTHLPTYTEYIRSGEYAVSGKPNAITPVYHELRGKKWGIIGYGNIGRAVGEVAKAFGCELVVNKRTPIEGVKCEDINTLCRECDIITLHCPLNEQTRGLIGKEQLDLMKPQAILVNESRGAVTDEAAVAEAVLSGKIAGFGSDVYSNEPFGEEHPFNKLLCLENVCLTPHSAWAAFEARERCLNIIAENIEAFKRGENKNRVEK